MPAAKVPGSVHNFTNSRGSVTATSNDSPRVKFANKSRKLFRHLRVGSFRALSDLRRTGSTGRNEDKVQRRLKDISLHVVSLTFYKEAALPFYGSLRSYRVRTFFFFPSCSFFSPLAGKFSEKITSEAKTSVSRNFQRIASWRGEVPPRRGCKTLEIGFDVDAVPGTTGRKRVPKLRHLSRTGRKFERIYAPYFIFARNERRGTLSRIHRVLSLFSYLRGLCLGEITALHRRISSLKLLRFLLVNSNPTARGSR